MSERIYMKDPNRNALMNREEYGRRVLEHGDVIYVREQLDGRWGSYALLDLDPPTREKHIDRWWAEGRDPP